MSTDIEQEARVLSLVTAIQAGDTERLADLWEQVKRFVSMMANNRILLLGKAASVEFDDLYNSGFIAVARAAKSFDASTGYSFISYLALHLKTAFAEAMGTRGDKQKRDPLHRATSIFSPLPYCDDEDLTYEDITADSKNQYDLVEERLFTEQLHKALDQAISTLPSSEQIIIQSHYFEDKDFNTIASESNTSAEEVRNLNQDALRRLRKREAMNILHPYIEERTNYYMSVGPKEYQNTRTSAVEKITIIREQLLNGMSHKSKF